MTWDPWAEAERRVGLHVLVRRLPAELGPAVWHRYRGRRWILIDDRLSAVERRAALAHELLHDERNGGADGVGLAGTWAPVVERDEAACNREVARRLVPPSPLDAFCREATAFGGGVTAELVAAAFEVPAWVAAIALERLNDREPAAPARPDRAWWLP